MLASDWRAILREACAVMLLPEAVVQPCIVEAHFCPCPAGHTTWIDQVPRDKQVHSSRPFQTPDARREPGRF